MGKSNLYLIDLPQMVFSRVRVHVLVRFRSPVVQKTQVDEADVRTKGVFRSI